MCKGPLHAIKHLRGKLGSKLEALSLGGLVKEAREEHRLKGSFCIR